MTIRFAAAGRFPVQRLSRAGARAALRRPANDNGSAQGQDMLRAALGHFYRHGHAAARMASRNAEQAFFAGDRAAYARWLEICRLLDRRVADSLAAPCPASGTDTVVLLPVRTGGNPAS